MSVEFLKTRLHHGYRYKSRIFIFWVMFFDGLLSLFPRRRSPIPAQPRSILIMKPDHLGDLLMISAVLPFLRERYPEAAIDILCGSWGSSILQNNPAIRRLVKFDHIAYDRRRISACRKLLDFLLAVRQTVVRLLQERYDLCLNLRDAGGDLILLARLGGCRHVIGHATGGCGPLLDTVVPWNEGLHEAEHYLEVLRPLGVDAALADLVCRIFPQPDDHTAVAALLAEYHLDSFVVVHPGCGDRRKLRSAAFWAGIIDSLDPCFQVVITGTLDEEPLCREIEKLTSRPLHCMNGRLSVAQLYLLLDKAAALYALDSLAAHLGASAGIPTTVFWSETNDPGQWRPLGKKVEIRHGDGVISLLAPNKDI